MAGRPTILPTRSAKVGRSRGVKESVVLVFFFVMLCSGYSSLRLRRRFLLCLFFCLIISLAGQQPALAGCQPALGSKLRFAPCSAVIDTDIPNRFLNLDRHSTVIKHKMHRSFLIACGFLFFLAHQCVSFRDHNDSLALRAAHLTSKEPRFLFLINDLTELPPSPLTETELNHRNQKRSPCLVLQILSKSSGQVSSRWSASRI